jgi:peptidoglycan/LPS O-acetylase OafA/YrhL
LDGLRFLAFLAVYVNHTFLFGVDGHHQHLPDRLAHLLGTVGVAGAFGVDLFFVLSAYLITELLLRERISRGQVDVPAFYVRRILRIWPLYFLFLAAAYGLTFFVPGEGLSGTHLMAFALFSGNWMYMLHPVGTVAAPLWSVSVEEQFYILWPWAVRRGPVRRIAVVALAMVAVGMAVRLGLGLRGIHEPWISKDSLTRADGIAAGVLLATFLQGRLPQLGGLSRTSLALGGVGGLLLLAARFHLFAGPITLVEQTLGWPLVALCCSAVVVSALGAEVGLGAWLLRSPALVYLGRISYGLYVFHQVGLLVAERVFPAHGLNSKAWLGHWLLGLAVTATLAVLSHRVIEQPFLRLKQRRFTVVHSRPE